MSRSTRLFLIFALVVVMLTIAGIGVATAAVYRAGSIAVDLQDDNTDVQVAVPAALAHLAILALPTSFLEDAAHEVEPLLPAARAVWTELETLPDFVLAEVVSDGERIVIEKRGGQLIVRITGADTNLQVGLPLRTVGALLSKLERAA